MAIQGHPRSLILVTMEILLVINSNLGPILPRLPEILHVSAEKSDDTPIPPEFWGMFPLN